ncbi:MAG: polysaccharide deacetylase family protein, partial [Gemmatimonadales bacterium]
MAGEGQRAPVFSEPTGRRWQRVRAGAMVLGGASILVVVGLIAAALLPPVLPQAHPTPVAARRRPAPPVNRTAERAHTAARGRLYRALRRGAGEPPGRSGAGVLRVAPAPADSILAGFYVNWDDHSYESLRKHLYQLDWVIAEWAFVAPSGDSLRISPDTNHILDLIRQLPADRRPKVLLMVSNVQENTAGRFGGANTARLLTHPELRRAVAARLAAKVASMHLAGVTVDFENVPDALLPQLSQFLDELRAALAPGMLLTQAIQDYLPPEWVHRFAVQCDRVILMIYDEHYAAPDPGPIAGRGWYTEVADSLLAVIPPGKAMMGIGAYGGYDWNDAGNSAHIEQYTVGDIWELARANHVLPSYDTDVYNPYLAWTDADSVDHFIWYLDATTVSDQLRIGRSRGVPSAAIWRLGAEDPSMWRMLGRHGKPLAPDSADTIDPGYAVHFDGDGELLAVLNRPLPGRREIAIDSTGLVSEVTTDSIPGEWVVARFGKQEHETALTFDDGPDPRWTPSILDTLKSRHAPGTFFLIGDQVTAHYALTRRILREGNEIGNNTFTHPDLSKTSR